MPQRVGVVVPQPHTPPAHVWPEGQMLSHADNPGLPQLFGSFRVLVHLPLQSV